MALEHLALAAWKPFKSIWRTISGIARIDSRLTAIEQKIGEPNRSEHRKCPKCGERDFRLEDAYRARPDPFGARYFHQKWLCYSCQHREEVNIEEPD